SSENAYLKFILSTLPVNTPGSEVEKATLKLYVGKIKSVGKLDVYAVAGQWDANSITANNVPPLGSLVTTTAQIATDHEGKFLSVDLPHRLYQ
ncbi:MAG TPA: DNRLRE domain-containing protein, partial [Blastocatellia bacterium]|nr:DNRLRE domain-containing protein [Blastocatellia bacterium]